MWLYRAYSGNLYHGGELVRTLPSFTQGDTITCILDMEAHTVSFAKNDKVRSNIYRQYSSDWVLCSCLIFVCLFSFSFRSQSWHLKVWSLMNCILVSYSTAVTLERRYSVYCTDLLDLLIIWIWFIISMENVKYLETQAATHTVLWPNIKLLNNCCTGLYMEKNLCFTYCTICFKNILYCKTPQTCEILHSSQVALSDLQMRGMPSSLLPGDPLCSPRATVLLESTVQLLRRLHQCDQWSPHINHYIHTHLELIGPLLREDNSGNFSTGHLPS